MSIQALQKDTAWQIHSRDDEEINRFPGEIPRGESRARVYNKAMGRMLSNVPLAPQWKSDREIDEAGNKGHSASKRQPRPGLRAPTPGAAQPNVELADENGSFRKMAFLCGLAMIFIRMSVTPELLAYFTHTNTYVLYLVGPPAILGVLISGGLGRALRTIPTLCFLGIFLYLLPATLMSTWQGGSFQVLSIYGRTSLPCLFVLSCTVVSWKEISKVFKTMAVSGFVVLFVTKFLATPDAEGRLTFDVTDSTIGNPNDLAAHLLLLLPFVMYYGFRPGGGKVAKVVVSLLGAFGIYSILGTSSRGALIGLGVMALLLFAHASGFQRLLVAVIAPVMAVSLVMVLPAQNLARLATLFHPDDTTASDIAGEAAESRESRQYLLRKSIEYTLEHPVLGVGPGQFSIYEGLMSKAAGEHGTWHETHNTYTQISSECGLPALIMLLVGTFGALGTVGRTRKRALARGNREIAAACSCFMVSWLGYLVTIFFLACAYRFTLPAMTGMAIAISFAAEREFNITAPLPA